MITFRSAATAVACVAALAAPAYALPSSSRLIRIDSLKFDRDSGASRGNDIRRRSMARKERIIAEESLNDIESLFDRNLMEFCMSMPPASGATMSMSMPSSFGGESLSMSIPSSFGVNDFSMSIPSSFGVEDLSMSMPSVFGADDLSMSLPSMFGADDLSMSLPSTFGADDLSMSMGVFGADDGSSTSGGGGTTSNTDISVLSVVSAQSSSAATTTVACDELVETTIELTAIAGVSNGITVLPAEDVKGSLEHALHSRFSKCDSIIKKDKGRKLQQIPLAVGKIEIIRDSSACSMRSPGVTACLPFGIKVKAYDDGNFDWNTEMVNQLRNIVGADVRFLESIKRVNIERIEILSKSSRSPSTNNMAVETGETGETDEPTTASSSKDDGKDAGKIALIAGSVGVSVSALIIFAIVLYRLKRDAPSTDEKDTDTRNGAESEDDAEAENSSQPDENGFVDVPIGGASF